MIVKQNNSLRLALFVLVIQVLMGNIALANDDDVDAEFLEFLADMEEATGSGFDAWLNDSNEDLYSIDSNEEQNIQSNSQ